MRFIKDEKGVAALEFALLAPLLGLLMMGVIEITNFMSVMRRAEMSANSMAQILTTVGRGQVGAMHNVWQVPVQINPTQYVNRNWRDGDTWRVPFSFSQIVFKQVDPLCTDNCILRPLRDFMFSFGGNGMYRTCNVKTIEAGKEPILNFELPEQYLQRGNPVMMIGHTVEYKPYFVEFFESWISNVPYSNRFYKKRRGTYNIRKIVYATRYDGEIWLYPRNGFPMYKYCGGPRI